MNKITSLLIALVFMFQSTALFAKAVTTEFYQAATTKKMMTKLNKKLEREVKKKNKTSLKRVHNKYKKKLKRVHKKMVSNIIKNSEIKDIDQALEFEGEIYAHNLDVLGRQIEEAKSYEQFLSNIITELSYDINSEGVISENGMQSMALVPLIVIGLIVVSIPIALILGLFLIMLIASGFSCLFNPC
jgi:hypothetical protein